MQELRNHPDFEVSASLPSSVSNVNWTLTFHCSDQWKWSEDAPHSWRIKCLGMSLFSCMSRNFNRYVFAERLEIAEKTGEISRGEMKMTLNLPPLSATNDGDKTCSILVQTQLFLCASTSGVCTKKTVTILLKISVDEDSQSIDGCNIHHEVNIN